MATKSDKLKKKMAMIARDREEYEQQKISMKEDIEYSTGKKENRLSVDVGDDDDDEGGTIKRSTSRSIRRHGTADDGDSGATSRHSGRHRRNSGMDSGSGSGTHSKLMHAAVRNVSNPDMATESRALQIPSGRKISDWCYTSPPDSTPPVLKGQQDLYVDVRFIGRGAFGTVDLIKNKEDNKLYAVKTLLVQNKVDQTSFLHEVKYLRNRHPFIIHLHDVFITTNPKKVYLVMHYCEGGDLGKVISAAAKSQNHIPEGQIYKWFCQISLAVEFLHDLRIVHRDIKPQNLLLSDSGEVAQLADFGLATQLADTQESFESCEVGTPYYTAPEMINAQPCACPVDNWSLGIVLFELLALDMPFDGVDTMSLVKSILSDDFRADLIPQGVYAPELLTVLAGLLCKDPAARTTCGQLLSSPGFSCRASNLPASYRPKYLEERLRRAHAKQMTRQLERLDVQCGGISATTSFNSIQCLSPAPSARLESPTQATSSSRHVSPTNTNAVFQKRQPRYSTGDLSPEPPFVLNNPKEILLNNAKPSRTKSQTASQSHATATTHSSDKLDRPPQKPPHKQSSSDSHERSGAGGVHVLRTHTHVPSPSKGATASGTSSVAHHATSLPVIVNVTTDDVGADGHQLSHSPAGMYDAVVHKAPSLDKVSGGGESRATGARLGIAGAVVSNTTTITTTHNNSSRRSGNERVQSGLGDPNNIVDAATVVAAVAAIASLLVDEAVSAATSSRKDVDAKHVDNKESTRSHEQARPRSSHASHDRQSHGGSDTSTLPKILKISTSASTSAKHDSSAAAKPHQHHIHNHNHNHNHDQNHNHNHNHSHSQNHSHNQNHNQNHNHSHSHNQNHNHSNNHNHTHGGHTHGHNKHDHPVKTAAIDVSPLPHLPDSVVKHAQSSAFTSPRAGHHPSRLSAHSEHSGHPLLRARQLVNEMFAAAGVTATAGGASEKTALAAGSGTGTLPLADS